MLGLLSQQAASCSPAAFLGLLAALFKGSAALHGLLEAAREQTSPWQLSEDLRKAWERHAAVCAAGTSALQRVHDKGEAQISIFIPGRCSEWHGHAHAAVYCAALV